MQCYYCGRMECKNNRCRQFNATVEELAVKYQVPEYKAKKWMGHFCTNCGQVGGHRGKCHKFCRFCGSSDHNSQVHPECPYWNGWGILTLLYNDNFVRNQVIKDEHKHTTQLDSYWCMNKELKIEKTVNNSKVYNKIVRQVEILKYLCDIGDFYCTDKTNIRTIDRLYNENQTQIQKRKKKEMDESKEKKDGINGNENENKEESNNNNENGKEKENENDKEKKHRHHRGRKNKQNATKRCFYCDRNIEKVVKYKKCKCTHVYCSKCWYEIFMDDDEIQCYECQDMVNGKMEIVINPNAQNIASDLEWDSNSESDDWQNMAVDSDSESDSESEDDDDSIHDSSLNEISVTTSLSKNKRNQKNNKNNKDSNKENNKKTKDKKPTIKYDVNRQRKGNRNRNRFNNRSNINRNGNFGMNAKNKKFKIVKGKNKSNGKRDINERLKRKIKHNKKKKKKKKEKKKEKNKNKEQQKQKELHKKNQVNNVKNQKIYTMMAGDEILTMENIKFIGSDERIRLAIGVRIAKYFEDAKIENIEERVGNIVNQQDINDLIDLANDQELRKLLINRIKEQDMVDGQKNGDELENQNQNENNQRNENTEEDENSNSGENKEKDKEKEKEKEKIAQNENEQDEKDENNNNGIILHSHTRGFDFNESNESNSEDHEQDSDVGNGNQNLQGRTGNEMGAASGNTFVDDENENVDGYELSMGLSMGFGAGFDSNIDHKKIVNSGQIDDDNINSNINGNGNVNTCNVENVENVSRVGTSVNRNMGTGNIISSISGTVQKSLLDEKVKLLKDKSKTTTAEAVDNEAYTVNNPSMDDL